MAAMMASLGEAATWTDPMQEIKRYGSNVKDYPELTDPNAAA